MQKLFRMLRTVAPHVRTALVSGETGTGKELVARCLHDHSERRRHHQKRGFGRGGGRG